MRQKNQKDLTVKKSDFGTFSQLFLAILNQEVQEACNKCFAVHILKFEILQIT